MNRKVHKKTFQCAMPNLWLLSVIILLIICFAPDILKQDSETSGRDGRILLPKRYPCQKEGCDKAYGDRRVYRRHIGACSECSKIPLPALSSISWKVIGRSTEKIFRLASPMIVIKKNMSTIGQNWVNTYPIAIRSQLNILWSRRQQKLTHSRSTQEHLLSKILLPARTGKISLWTVPMKVLMGVGVKILWREHMKEQLPDESFKNPFLASVMTY